MPVDRVGPPVVFVTVYRLHPYVPDEVLLAALAPYGKLCGVQHAQFKDSPTKFTGTRVVWLEMLTPVPNLMTIQGHKVMLQYEASLREVQLGGPLGGSMQDTEVRPLRRLRTRNGGLHSCVPTVRGATRYCRLHAAQDVRGSGAGTARCS